MIMVMQPIKAPSIVIIIVLILLILHLSKQGPEVSDYNGVLIIASIDQGDCPVLGLLATCNSSKIRIFVTGIDE